jgi:hypothetical protein
LANSAAGLIQRYTVSAVVAFNVFIEGFIVVFLASCELNPVGITVERLLAPFAELMPSYFQSSAHLYLFLFCPDQVLH